MKNELKPKGYMKVRNIIRSCRNLAEWQTAFRCLLNYEAMYKEENELRIELYEKEQQLTNLSASLVFRPETTPERMDGGEIYLKQI